MYLVLGWSSFHIGGSSILEDASQLVQSLCARLADLLAHRLVAQDLRNTSPTCEACNGVQVHDPIFGSSSLAFRVAPMPFMPCLQLGVLSPQEIAQDTKAQRSAGVTPKHHLRESERGPADKMIDRDRP